MSELEDQMDFVRKFHEELDEEIIFTREESYTFQDNYKELNKYWRN